MTNSPSPKWRRTKTIYPNTLIRDDDWPLLDATGDRIAQLFNIDGDDLIGSWRWPVVNSHAFNKHSSRPPFGGGSHSG